MLNKKEHCVHYDGSVCVNMIGNYYGKECDCPEENNCYKGD